MIRKKITELVIDLMQNAVKGILLITSISIASFICWLVYNILTHLAQWLNNTIFSSPWGNF